MTGIRKTGLTMNKGKWLTVGLLAIAAVSLAGWLLVANTAAAREIFRDGKWIVVPDDSDVEPLAGRSADEHAATPSTPATATNDGAPATPEAPSVESAAGNPAPAAEEAAVVEQPAVAENVSDPAPQPVAVESGVQNPAEMPVVVEQPRDVASAPSSSPATTAVLVGQSQSVGERYLNPAPSEAVAEVRSVLAPVDVPTPAAVEKSIGLFERGKYGQVRRETKRYLKAADMGPFGEAARWLEAEAAFSQGEYNPARKSYDKFVTSYSGSPLADKAMVRQMESAEALLGPARIKFLGLRLLSGETEAIDTLHSVYGRSPTGPLAADALFRIGEYRFSKRDYVEAQDVFVRFAREFPNHSRTRQAELLAAQSGMNAIVGATYDISTMQKSKEILERYEQKYPAVAADEHVPQALQAIRETEALKRLEMARYYSRAGKPSAAAFYARRVMERYASTPQAAEAAVLLEKTQQKLAKERS